MSLWVYDSMINQSIWLVWRIRLRSFDKGACCRGLRVNESASDSSKPRPKTHLTRHESNHVTEIAHKTIGDLSDMLESRSRYRLPGSRLPVYSLQSVYVIDCHCLRFCFSSLLTKGSIYHDLLICARRILFKRLRITYDPLAPYVVQHRDSGLKPFLFQSFKFQVSSFKF